MKYLVAVLTPGQVNTMSVWGTYDDFSEFYFEPNFSVENLIQPTPCIRFDVEKYGNNLATARQDLWNMVTNHGFSLCGKKVFDYSGVHFDLKSYKTASNKNEFFDSRFEVAVFVGN